MNRLPGAPSRLSLIALAVAGALAGSAGAASAQYYVYEDEYEVPSRFGYGNRYRDDYYFRPVPPRVVVRTPARGHGLSRIDRTLRTGSTFVVDGRSGDGSRVRLIYDRYSGDLIDRITISPAPRAAPLIPRPAPRIARIDPDEDARPASPPKATVRPTPQPPERPASLKPPAQASAPATLLPPSPAAPSRASEPERPVAPPARASAPATVTPPSPAAPAPEEPAAPGPRLVNPEDVRGADAPERKPPLARADPSGINVAPVQLPPVQIDDATPSRPLPETPAVPVAPLE